MKIFNPQLLAKLILVIINASYIIQLQKKQLIKHADSQDRSTYVNEEKQYKIQANLQKKSPVFGYENLMADLSFLQFLQYFGDGEARAITGYSVVPDFFEAIVYRDPYFIDAQFIISPANSLFAAQPETTISLIEKTLESVNADTPGYPFFLWTYKATDEILFMGDLASASSSYKMASLWAKLRQDKLGNELSERFSNTVKFLASNPNSVDARIGAWTNVLSQAKDLKTQQHAIDELEKLGAKVSITEEGKINILRSNRT